MKFIKALIIFKIYILILFLIYILHIKFFEINVIFYSTLVDVLLAASLIIILFVNRGYFSIYNNFEKIQLIIIFLLVGYSLAISVPTVIDRSLSFYILEKIEQRGGGIKLSRFEEVFTKEYIYQHRLMDVRLTEQQESGSIIIINECVKLTNRGKILVIFSKFFRENLLPKKRLLMGKYSDDLTHPFKNDNYISDYQCK